MSMSNTLPYTIYRITKLTSDCMSSMAFVIAVSYLYFVIIVSFKFLVNSS